MRMSDASIFVAEGSAIRPFAETIGWLWRVPVTDRPGPDSAGLGTIDEMASLHSLLRARRLAGVAVFGTRPGPDLGPLPGRARIAGVAKFSPGYATRGDFTLLRGPGRAVASSSLGPHALREGKILTLGFDPLAGWGTLQHFWVYPALADFLADVLERPMAMLSPVGVVRYDDAPGTAAKQLAGTAKPDGKVERRLRRLLRTYRGTGSTLNVAMASRALEGDEPVPLERAWPRSVELLAGAVAEGTVEQVCHGYLHVDTSRSRPGAVEPREFGNLDRDEAKRRIIASLEWAEATLGARPRTFVAPNWSYSDGALAALAELDLPAWLPLGFGPLIEGPNMRETLVSTLNGLHGLDYGPLAGLAHCGVPPMVVIHGGLIDARFRDLSFPRDAGVLARLALRRDLFRLPAVAGIRWIRASELLERIRAHDQVEVSGSEIRGPDGIEVTARRVGAAP
jgi:hypothetical protein